MLIYYTACLTNKFAKNTIKILMKIEKKIDKLTVKK